MDTGEIHRGPLLAEIAELKRALAVVLGAEDSAKNWAQRYDDIIAHNERIMRDLVAANERGDKWKLAAERLNLNVNAANERANGKVKQLQREVSKLRNEIDEMSINNSARL